MSEDILASLRSNRPSGCPRDHELFAFDVQDLPPKQQSSVGEHVKVCAECQAFLSEMHGSFARIPSDAQNAVVSLMHKASARPAPAPKRWGVPQWLGGLAALATGLAFFVLAKSPVPVEPDTLSKGGLDLVVYRERDGKVDSVMSGDSFQQGDRLRFSVSLPKSGYVGILGVENSGKTYPAFPSGGGAARSLPPGSGQLLSDAIQLDASEGRETLILVVCERPFDIETFRPSSPDCQTHEFVLNKPSEPRR